MHTDNPRGIAAMTASMALFVGSDALMKFAAQTVPVTQTIFLRGALLTAILLVLAAAQRKLRYWRMLAHAGVLARAGLETAASFGYLLALAHIPLAIALAINMATPLAALPFAVLLLHEGVGWRRWSALAVGFSGVMLVLQPVPGSIDWWALLSFSTTFVFALRDVGTRLIPAAIPSILVTVTSAAAITLVGAVAVLLAGWQPVGASDLAVLAAAAIVVGGGMHLLVIATRIAEASAVGGLRYSAMVWAVAIGYLVWGDLPGHLAWGGIALIVGAGLYTAHRERVRMALARQR